MSNTRDAYIAKIQELQAAINSSTSVYLKADYQKRIKRMRKELAEYDYYHRNVERETT